MVLLEYVVAGGLAVAMFIFGYCLGQESTKKGEKIENL